MGNDISRSAYIKCRFLVRGKEVELVVVDYSYNVSKIFGVDIREMALQSILPGVVNDRFVQLCQEIIGSKESQEYGLLVDLGNRQWILNILYVGPSHLMFQFNGLREEKYKHWHLKLLNDLSYEHLKRENEPIDYQNIIGLFTELGMAKYAVLNIFNEDEKSFKTVAFSGGLKEINAFSTLIGFNFIGKEWEANSSYMSKIQGGRLIEFDSLMDIVGNSLPSAGVKLITKLFNLGKVYVCKIQTEDHLVGEFTVFMEKNHDLKITPLLEIFINQVGILISRYKLQQIQAKDHRLFKAMMNSIREIIIIINNDGIIEMVSPKGKELIEESQEKVIGANIFTVISNFGVSRESQLYEDLYRIYRLNQKLVRSGEKILLTHHQKPLEVGYSIAPLDEGFDQIMGCLLRLQVDTNQ